MTIHSYNPYERYRRRFWQQMAGIGVVLFVMAGAIALGFFFGRQYALQDQAMLRNQVGILTQEKQALEEAVTGLRAESLTATTRLQDLQKTYDETVPEGPVQELIALVNRQIEEGMDPERLAFLVRSARPPRNCTDPEVQRIVLSTPAYKGPPSEAGIADGVIVIKGSGISPNNLKGEPEAWYDPGKPVSLQFLLQDGRTEEKKGVMPLYHSLVVGDREYRFTVTEGAKSFARITFNSCDYP